MEVGIENPEKKGTINNKATNLNLFFINLYPIDGKAGTLIVLILIQPDKIMFT